MRYRICIRLRTISAFSAAERLIDLEENPSYVIADIGCTRAMGSRFAVEKLQQALVPLGATIEWRTCTTRMTFANNDTSYLEWCVVITFPTNQPVCTTIDVLDKGQRPILLSLQQQMNFRMTYALEPDKAYVTCELLKMKHELCQFSTTRHIVLDPSRLCGKDPEKQSRI